MHERDDWLQNNSLERTLRSPHLDLLLGGCALLLVGGWAIKKFSPEIRQAFSDTATYFKKSDESDRLEKITLFRSLAESFGATVSDYQVDYWDTMLTISRPLDVIVDKLQPEDIDKEALSLICGQPIDGVSREAAARFSATLHSASQERRDIILRGLQISDLAKTLKATERVDEMLEIRSQEAVIYAEIMTIDNPHQDSATLAFNEWLIGLGRAGYHLDTFIDLAKDYKENTVGVVPTLDSYAFIAKQTYQNARPALLGLPLTAIPPLIKFGIKKVAKGVLSRYSSNQEHKQR